LRQILISTARPPKEVTKEIDKLNQAVEGSNVAFGVAAIQQKGVLGVLDELNRATGGSSEAFAKLFTDVDGLKGVLNLSAQGFESVRKEVGQALTYPAILVMSGVAAIMTVFIAVVPRFAGLLRNNNHLQP
jgi:hypothetical protein